MAGEFSTLLNRINVTVSIGIGEDEDATTAHQRYTLKVIADDPGFLEQAKTWFLALDWAGQDECTLVNYRLLVHYYQEDNAKRAQAEFLDYVRESWPEATIVMRVLA